MRSRRGFTLLELIAVVVILGILSSLAVPSFAAVAQVMRERTTKIEAEALTREAKGMASFAGRDVIYTEDFGSNDMDRSVEGSQIAAGSSPWPYTSEHVITVYIYEDGSVSDTPPLMTSSFSPEPLTTSIDPIAPDGPVDLQVNTTDGAVALDGLGTFIDNYNGLLLNRTETGLILDLSAANWEYMTLIIGDDIDTLYKTSGPKNVGVMTKLSNTDVTISVGPGVSFNLTIKYNGGSSGMEYNLQALA